MKHLTKTLCKTISALIVLAALNTSFTRTFLLQTGFTDSPPPALLPVLTVICRGLFAYINLFPSLTLRRVSTTRNKVLEDGIALLQIFLATTAVENLYIAALFLYRLI